MLYKYILSWPGAADVTTITVLIFLVTVAIVCGIKAAENACGFLARRRQPYMPDMIDLAYEELCRNPE